MADFTSSFWNYFVIVLTAISILACGVFLYLLSRKKVKAGESVDTTGHVWDENLQEFDNPLPRWWMILFYITIVFSILYLVLYPGLGNVQGRYRSQVGSVAGTLIQTKPCKHCLEFV